MDAQVAVAFKAARVPKKLQNVRHPATLQVVKAGPK